MKGTKDPTKYLVCSSCSFSVLFLLFHTQLIDYSTHTADIVLVVKDAPHALFHRKGHDLIYEPRIPLVTVSTKLKKNKTNTSVDLRLSLMCTS